MGSNANHFSNSKPLCHQVTISTTEEMSGFIDRVTRSMTTLGYAEKDIFGVRLGLEEAIVNAIRHGNRLDPAKKVRLNCSVDAKKFLVQIEDEGAGFDPNDFPDPLAPENLERACGRGVFLMNSYMTWIKYNDKGNCVLMCKERSK